jgi:hypothetical protein
MKRAFILIFAVLLAGCKPQSQVPPPQTPENERFAHALAAGGQYGAVLESVRGIVRPGDRAADHSSILATADKTRTIKNGTAYYFNWYLVGGKGPKSEQGDGYILITVDQSSGKIELVTGNVEGK